MRAFEYANPTTKEQAVGLLGQSESDAQILAGGTDLLSLMKDDVIAPKRLVNIKDIPELKGLNFSPGGMRVGATVTIQELLDNRRLRRLYPSIWQAAEGITSPQIRNMGTVAGDLCQRPRCWYYRAGFGLFARGEDGKSLVPNGDNRYHAIIGNAGPAYFVNPSSLAPALIALGAKVHIHGPKGEREMMLETFFTIPQSDGEREYRLDANEIVTEITVPPPRGSNTTYEVRQKEALDWPLATASVVLDMNGDNIAGANIVLGHVAPIPWRSRAAGQFLVDKKVNEEVAQKAGEIAVSEAKALSRNGYKIQLAKVAVKRAILEAANGGRK